MTTNKIFIGDTLKVLRRMPSESVDCIITSPPYWALRDYGVAGQIGVEGSPKEYVERLCDIFDETKRVLKKEGTLFVNLGDTYGGTNDKGDYTDPKYPKGRTGQRKAINSSATKKSLCQIPSRFAIAMCERGWILRNEIIWHKPNAMPSSVTDRFTVDFEKVFFFVKSRKYYFEQQKEKSIWGEKDNRAGLGRLHYRGKKRQGRKGTGQENFVSVNEYRNKRAVWTVSTKPFKDAHFATFPTTLIEPMLLAGCPQGGVCLDPFIGSGTVGVVALRNKREYLGIDINASYVRMARKRIKDAKII